MFQQTNQSNSTTPGENFLFIKDLQIGSSHSHIFRNILVESGYSKFDAKSIKGDICYDAYFKDFKIDNELKFTIFCYCYELKGIVDDPELLEFELECQIETHRGVIGIESVQWNFTNYSDAKTNLEYFEDKINLFWTSVGSHFFPK